MKCGIYIIKSINTDKVYVGSSKDIEKRWKLHIRQLKCNKHHSIKFQRLFDKYGVNDLVFQVLEECTLIQLIEREQHYLDQLDFATCLNIGKNSSGGDNLSQHPDKVQIRERIMKTCKKNRDTLTREQKQKKYGHPQENNFHWKGGVMKEKTTCECGNKKGYSARICIKCSWKNRSGTFLGKVHSEETKEKIRQSRAVKNQKLPFTTKRINIDEVLYNSQNEASRILGIQVATISNRIKNKNFPNYSEFESSTIKAELSTGLIK